MSNRSLLEFNHDYCPPNDDAACLALGRALRDYMRAANTAALPPGVVQKHFRHHSEPCPLARIEAPYGTRPDGTPRTLADCD